MTIAQIFKLLIRHNKPLAIALLSILGLAAVLAVVELLRIDLHAALVPIAILSAVFLIVVVMNHIVRDPKVGLVLSWFFLSLLVIYTSITAISAVFRPPWLPPPYCLFYPLEKDCNAVAKTIADRNLPPIMPKSNAEPPPSQALQAEKACAGVDITRNPGSAPDAAWWCGTGGARRTTRVQAVRDPTPSCLNYATKPFADLSQNELYRAAVKFAKDGNFEAAFEQIDACQCHNPNSQALIREGKQRMLCFLRVQ